MGSWLFDTSASAASSASSASFGFAEVHRYKVRIWRMSSREWLLQLRDVHGWQNFSQGDTEERALENAREIIARWNPGDWIVLERQRIPKWMHVIRFIAMLALISNPMIARHLR